MNREKTNYSKSFRAFTIGSTTCDKIRRKNNQKIFVLDFKGEHLRLKTFVKKSHLF